MVILIKIALLILTFCWGNKFVGYNEYMCAVISYGVSAFLFIDLGQRYMKNVYGDYTKTTASQYHTPKKDDNRYAYWNDWESYNNFEDTYSSTIPKEHKRFLPKTYTTTKTEVEKIVSTMKVKANVVEFCGEEVKYQTKVAEKNKKETSLPPKMQQQKVEKAAQKEPKELIMVVNEDTVNVKRKRLYEAILKLLQSKKLKADKLYAMLQSFAHIDIAVGGIVFYIDSLILTKAKIAIDEPLMNEIREVTRKALNSPELIVEFTEKKNVTLLNYFLKK